MSVVVEAGGGWTQEYGRQGTGDWTGHRTPGGRNVRAGKAAANGPVREKSMVEAGPLGRDGS